MSTLDGLTTSAAPARDDRAGGQAWFVTAMIVILLIINFGDKAVLGLAAVPIIKEFHLSNSAYGFISSSFFFLFSISSVLAGIMALRIRARWIMLVMALAWSVCQVPVIAGMGVGGLIASRIALGGFEGPNSSIGVHVAHDWHAPLRRGLPTALSQAGGGLGLAIAAPSLTFLIIRFGWRSAFLALALVGLVWAVVWVLTVREGPYAAPAAKDRHPRAAAADPAEPSVLRIMLRPTWWGSLVIAFAGYWALTLVSAWLPPYLEKQLGFSATAASTILTVTPLIGVAAQLGTMILSDRMLRRGIAPRSSRGRLNAAFALLAGLCTIAFAFLGTSWLMILLLAVGLGVPVVAFPLCHAAVADISPPGKRSATLGWLAGLWATAGLIAPAVTGLLIDGAPSPHDGYVLAWCVTGGLMTIAAVVGALTIDPARDARQLGLRPVI
jgi:MFS family permease